MSDSKSLLHSSNAKVPESAAETIQYALPLDTSSAASFLLPNGTSLGHYVIKSYIGGGGMGQVYLATDTALDRDVAIKVLTQQRAGDQSTVARFMNEARSAARLNHEHIAQVYFAGTASDIPFIAFEYVEGINLRVMIEENDVLPLPQALNYLLQIAHALAHAATHNIVHRDVKPSNILITQEGRAKLIDMGLARLLDTSEGKNDLTASGVTLGTFDYISPEQARDSRNADIRSDIYSLGCTFFFMLSGRPPFPEGSVLQKLLQHQGDTPPDIRSFQPSTPAEIAFLIQKMMAKDPRQRFQTPLLLIEALTNAARNLGLRPAGHGNLVWTPIQTNHRSFFLHHLPWMTAVTLLFFGVFLQSLLSGRTDRILVPEVNISNTPPSITVPPVPVNPTQQPSRPFDAAFVISGAVPDSQYSAGLTAKTVNGSLQPRLMMAGQLQQNISGQLNAISLKNNGRETTTQQTESFSEVRCVDPTANTIGAYNSIASALVGAQEGTTIELKWNNILRITEPIQVNNRSLKFVAAEGYSPILLLEPMSELPSTRSCFTVASCNLTFHRVGIAIQLNPSVLSPHWSLFELSGNTQLTFEQCCLTVQNRTIFDDAPYHDDVVFFRNTLPADNLEGLGYSESANTEPLKIDIKDSLIRGEAVMIQNNVSQDISVDCSNSFLALARSFIQVEENRQLAQSVTIQMNWEKIIFLGRQSVINLVCTASSKETANESLSIDFETNQSVFVLNNYPFVVFNSFPSQEQALENFRWSGHSNYFQNVSGLRFSVPSFSPSSGTVGNVSLEDWLKERVLDGENPVNINSLALEEVVKPISRFLPQDLKKIFVLEPNVPLPDFDWFPKLWNE